MAIEADQVVGSIMAGYDGHRGWISRIATLQSHRQKGIGEALIHEAERRLAGLGCIKINLQIVASNSTVLGF
ncbi:GNAT family N-acetyltransferase [Mesorhizobium sp. M0184]